jgi:DNA-binding protein YbaB
MNKVHTIEDEIFQAFKDKINRSTKEIKAATEKQMENFTNKFNGEIRLYYDA